jgi:hypothetical protein
MSLLNGLFPIATDNDGRTIPNALLYSYTVGTNTPKDTYSDVGLTTPNANPLEADGAGWFPDLYLGAGGYKLVLRDASGTVLKTQDNYYPAADSADIASLQAQIDTLSSDASLIGGVYTDSGAANAYVLTIQGALEPPTAYASPMQIIFIPTSANTGASTVNVESLGLKDLQDQSGNALTSGFLETGKYFCFIYQSGAFRYMWRSGLVSTKGIATSGVETANIKDKNVTLGKIADGTAHELFAYDSSGVATTVVNPMRLLASGGISAGASIEFKLATLQPTQSANNGYLIRLRNVAPASDDVMLYATLSNDNGATYGATNYESVAFGYDNTATLRTAVSAAGAQMVIAGDTVTAMKSLSNAVSEYCTVEMRLYTVNSNQLARPNILWETGYVNADGAVTRQSGFGYRTDGLDYDAIKFTLSAGNFTAIGSYYIWAIPGEI